MATEQDREQKRKKAKERNEARKRAKAPREKPHSKKGIATQASDATPRAAGHPSEAKKKATHGEQGAHAGRPRKKKPGK